MNKKKVIKWIENQRELDMEIVQEAGFLGCL